MVLPCFSFAAEVDVLMKWLSSFRMVASLRQQGPADVSGRDMSMYNHGLKDVLR